MILLGVFVICMVIGWVPDLGARMLEWVAFDPRAVLPWTFLTYPFSSVGLGSGLGLLFFLFLLYWWYWVGNALEPETGFWGLLVHFMVFSVMAALVVWVSVALGLQNPPMDVLVGPHLSVMAMSMVYFGRAPSAPVSFWGFPMQMKWLAVLIAAFSVLNYGNGNPLFGVVASLPLLVGWFYGQGRLPVRLGEVPFAGRAAKKKESREFDQFMTKVKSKEKEREERERLRKLFEDSLED